MQSLAELTGSSLLLLELDTGTETNTLFVAALRANYSSPLRSLQRRALIDRLQVSQDITDLHLFVNVPVLLSNVRCKPRDMVKLGFPWPRVAVALTTTARTITRRQCLSTKVVQPLAFDLHEPARPKFDKHTKPILFLHGLFGSKKNNRGMSKALARDLGRHVYAIDLRNHGESPHETRHDYTAMADDISFFIRDQALTDVTVIGHSMGAKTAMTLALGSSNIVEDLVAVDNAPIDATLNRDFAEYVRGMKKIQAAGITRQAEADAILQEFEKSLTIRQFLLGNMYRPSNHSVLEFRIPLDILGKALDNLGDFPFKDPHIRRFEKPALFVRGTKSKFVPDDVLPVIGQFFPRFRVVDVDAGHWLISEQPEAFRQAVVEFLTRSDSD